MKYVEEYFYHCTLIRGNQDISLFFSLFSHWKEYSLEFLAHGSIFTVEQKGRHALNTNNIISERGKSV